MKRLENLYDVTKRLCGMIEPTGESNADITRLQNLEDTINLVEQLTKDIVYVARNQTAYENSVKVIGKRADRFITEMREEITAQPTFTKNEIQQLQNKIHAITGDGEIMFEVQYRDLKTEFLAIQNDYIGKPLTMVLMEEINSRYYNLFNHFDLRDLQWRLTRGENSIIFTPIRAMDQYAVNGILAL